MPANKKLAVKSKKNAKNSTTICVEKKNVLSNVVFDENDYLSDESEEEKLVKKSKKQIKSSSSINSNSDSDNDSNGNKNNIKSHNIQFSAIEILKEENNVNTGSKLTELDENLFYKDNEINPKIDDSGWKELQKDKLWEYTKFNDIPEVEIKVSDYIETVKKLLKNNPYLPYKNNNHESPYLIHRIIKIYDGENVKYCNSSNSTELTLKNDIIVLLKNNTGKLENFKNNLNNVKYKLLGIYKGNGRVQSELNKFKKIYEGSVKKSKTKSDGFDILNDNNSEKTIWKFYEDVFNNEFTDNVKNKLDYNCYYVYRIYVTTNQTKQYIFGSFDKFKKKDVLNLLKKFRIDFDDSNAEIEVLEEIEECYLECIGLLKVDTYINKYNSIDNGYNLYYNVVNKLYFNYEKNNIDDMKKEIFMIIHKEIMLFLFKDTFNYLKDKGYIFLIKNKNNDNVFLDYGCENTLIDNLKLLYSMKYDESILIFFGNVKFLDMEITILEDNIDKNDVYYQYLCMLNKFNIYQKPKKIIDKENIVIPPKKYIYNPAYAKYKKNKW